MCSVCGATKQKGGIFAAIFCVWVAGLPDYSWSKITERGKIYQITTIYAKLPKNISNGRKIDQMVIKYAKIFHSKSLQK
jgi:hypothetical protein